MRNFFLSWSPKIGAAVARASESVVDLGVEVSGLTAVAVVALKEEKKRIKTRREMVKMLYMAECKAEIDRAQERTFSVPVPPSQSADTWVETARHMEVHTNQPSNGKHPQVSMADMAEVSA